MFGLKQKKKIFHVTGVYQAQTVEKITTKTLTIWVRDHKAETALGVALVDFEERLAKDDPDASYALVGRVVSELPKGW